MIFLLQILFSLSESQCSTKSNGGPTQLYPTLGSPMILDLSEYFNGSNLQYSFQGGQNGQIYQTTQGPELNVNLNGTVISSCQKQDNLQVNDPKFGIFALLTKNTSGYYVYQLQVSDTSIQVQQVGDGILGMHFSLSKVPFYINCFSLMYQQQGIFVSCVGSNNHPVIYYYGLNKNSSSTLLYPTPQMVVDSTLFYQVSSSYIIQYNSDTIVLGYQYTEGYQSTVLYVNLTNGTQYMNSLEYPSQLNGIWVQQELGIEFLLFTKYIYVEQGNFSDFYNFFYLDLEFVAFSVQYQFNILMTIATSQSIALLKYDLSFMGFTSLGQITYPSYFIANASTNMQLFKDDLFIIVSNGQIVLVYELIKPEQIFWSYQIGGSFNLQYETSNQILIIIMQQTIYTYQLFVPKLILQFDSILQGQLILNGNVQQNCSTQLNYSVIYSNNTNPLPSYLLQNYNINYPSQFMQRLSGLFVGQNLSYNISSTNSNNQIIDTYFSDFLNGSYFIYVNAFTNPFDINQFMIVYQLKNQNALQVIYCSLQYCSQHTKNQTFPGFLNLTSSLQSLTVGTYYNEDQPNKQLLEMVIIFNASKVYPTYYSCRFVWFEQYPQCETVELFTSLPPPSSQFSQVVFSGLNFYVELNNPSSIFLLGAIFIPQQFQTRQIFTNIKDYTNLLFLDNIYELSINIASTINNLLTQLTSIQYPIQQGNTSVGVGLLRQGIFIAQIDNKGNQYILFYDNIILTTTNFLQTFQPQQVKIPSGAVIQFPIISTFSSNKFYLVWNFNGSNEIAVLQPSSDINSMLYQSIYAPYQISSLNAVSIADYDQLFCMFSTGLVRQYFIINKSYIKIIPDNLLTEIKMDILLIITAFNTYSKQTFNYNYKVTNQIFDIKAPYVLPIYNFTLYDANYIQFNPAGYYDGMVNSFQGYNNDNDLNNVQGPITQFNGIIYVEPIPQAFCPYTDNQVLFQNNNYVYVLDNLYLGTYSILMKFIGMVNCPILYYNEYGRIIYSICQNQNQQIFEYTKLVGQEYTVEYYLNYGYGYLRGGGYFNEEMFYLNFGQLVVVIEYNQEYCQYYSIDGYLQMVAIYNEHIVFAFQLDSQNILIVIDCEAENIIRLGPIFNGYINSFSLNYMRNSIASYQLVVLSNQLGIIYYFNIEKNNVINIVFYQLLNDNLNMNGIRCQIVQNAILVAYETSPYNFSLIAYDFDTNNWLKYQPLPIIAYYSFYQQNISQFYMTKTGQILYVVDTGFSYLQFNPNIIIGINNYQLKSTQIQQVNEYIVSNSIMNLVIGNPFYNLNVSLDLTLVNYQGQKMNAKSFSSTTQFLSLLAISLLSIAGFVTFACIKIQRKKQWE